MRDLSQDQINILIRGVTEYYRLTSGEAPQPSGGELRFNSVEEFNAYIRQHKANQC